MKKRKWYVIGLAAVIVAGLVFAAVPALAAPANGRPAGNGAGMGCGLAGSMISSVAKLLGITPTDLAAQRHAGQSLADIAAAKGVDQDTLVNAVIADRQAALNELVTAGRITQAQADSALAVMKENIAANVTRTATGRPDNAGQCGLNLGLGRNGQGPNGNGQGHGPGHGMGRGAGRQGGGPGNGFGGQCPCGGTPSQTQSQSGQ